MKNMEILGQGKFLALYKSEVDGVSREWVKSKSAAAALIVNSNKEQVLLTSQIRPPICEVVKEKIFEPVAGIVEDGEKPHETIIREIEEETGIAEDDLYDMFYAGSFYSSPGLTNEIAHLYLIEVDKDFDLKSLKTNVTHENEKIVLKVVTFDEFLATTYRDWRLEILKRHIS